MLEPEEAGGYFDCEIKRYFDCESGCLVRNKWDCWPMVTGEEPSLHHSHCKLQYRIFYLVDGSEKTERIILA